MLEILTCLIKSKKKIGLISTEHVVINRRALSSHIRRNFEKSGCKLSATEIDSLYTRISHGLANRILELAERYEDTLFEIEDDVKTYTPQKVQKAAVNNTNEDKEAPELTTNVAMIQRISTLERKVYNLEQRMNQQDRTYQAN